MTIQNEVAVCCHECDRPLKTEKIVWLEYNVERDSYHRRGQVPDNESLGEYPFGADCAKKALAGETEN